MHPRRLPQDAGSALRRSLATMRQALAPLRLPGFGQLAGAYTVNEPGHWVGEIALAARAFTRASAAAVLTPSGQLRQGNALINVGFTAAGAAGPALGGLVVAALGVKSALLVDAGSFVAVAAVLALARSLPQVKSQEERARSRFLAGLGYVRHNRSLGALLVAQAAAFIFFTAVIPIEIVYAKD